jgi:hypothetical protein
MTQTSVKERVRARIESTYRPHEIFHEDDVVEAFGENRQSVSFQLWHLEQDGVLRRLEDVARRERGEKYVRWIRA